DVVLAGVVGAVGEPQLQVLRPGRVHDVDALHQVADGLAADPRVRVADAAELVVVVLEHVRVHGPDRDAVLLGERAQGRVVVDLVPGDVHRDARCHAGERVHLGRVLDLLLRRAGDPRLRENLEPGPGV